VESPGLAGLTHYLTNGRPKVVFFIITEFIEYSGRIDTGLLAIGTAVSTSAASVFGGRRKFTIRVCMTGDLAIFGELRAALLVIRETVEALAHAWVRPERGISQPSR
jgi:hypothetical protein